MMARGRSNPFIQFAIAKETIMSISTIKRLLILCVIGLGLFALAGLHSARVGAAPLHQTSCTLPATVTTAAELSSCITAAAR